MENMEKASWKQVWRVAYTFAEIENNQFPDIDKDTLARRMRASMLNYYSDNQTFLSNLDASKFIEGYEDCPMEILNRVIYK